MNTSAPVPPLMRIPPPVLFLLIFLAGVGLEHVVPHTVESENVMHTGRIVGGLLIAVAVLVVLWCRGMFLAAQTTIIPFRTPSSLVTDGPYRLSRNPLYVSLVLIYTGMAFVFAQLWPLLLLPLPVIFLHKIVIPFEEARLRESFGDAFQQYCARARRWI